MKAPRCGIYTRKSSEEGLDQGFNSLRAQREACEAYVLSQAGEGWKALPAIYDDGGFSGGTMERPALKRLLGDIAAGQVDIVVVYKVDRLTRSLHDFSRIVERFDANGVSFVSVTQAFNTTSSMGRLTLNMLLSFAQFEREVTGERIRDKIAASKAKGMWMGGRPPLGYDGRERKLVVNASEAAQVRQIFQRYLEVTSVVALTRDLKQAGQCSKAWIGKDGLARGGAVFSRGALYHLLSNPVYRGAIRHGDKLYPDAHPAIVDETAWDAVQGMLASHDRGKPATPKGGERALLTGLLFDDAGGAMSPIHTARRGRRYHYYVSAAAVHGDDAPIGTLPRIGAPVLEAFINQRVLPILKPHWRRAEPTEARVRGALRKVTLGESRVRIVLHQEAVTGEAELDLPIRLKHRQGATLIAPADQAHASLPRLDRALIRAVCVTRQWRASLESGEVASTKDLARREGLCHRHTGRILPLAYLAPDLIEAVLEGRQPPAMTLQALTERPLPKAWEDQRRLFASFT